MSKLASVGLAVLLSSIAGCARQAAPPAKAPEVAKADAKPTAPTPPDLSPNILRDRRAEAGVRAPAKALVRDKASSARCGKLTLAKDASESDLLGGRLHVRPPVGAKAPPPLADGLPEEEESRLVVEPGAKDKNKIAFAIVARETFQLDPDLYEPEADAPLKPATLDVEAPKFLKASFPSEEPLEVVPVAIGSLRAYAARPAKPSAPAGKDTALVLALLVAQDDGALQSIGFYVRGEHVRSATGTELVGCTRLAERVAASITPGPRKLERAAGERHVLDVSGDEALSVVVPQDYVVVRRASVAARLTKLRPLSLYQGSINISLGGDGKAERSPDGADATANGTLFGRPAVWHGKTTPKGGFFFAEGPLAGGPADGQAKTAAVLVRATRQAKALEEMRQVAETLAVVKKTR